MCFPAAAVCETVWNGTLQQSPEFSIAVPDEAIPDSGQLLVKFYPSRFSQVVEGLDAIFQLPSGCFEQTSSTTYPNVLSSLIICGVPRKVSRPLKQSARNFIHLGYQRLISFEVSGGGFDWFGNARTRQSTCSRPIAGSWSFKTWPRFTTSIVN